MKLFSLYLGSRTARHSPRFSVADEKLLSEITAAHFPRGFTILSAKGAWWNATSGKLEKEESREIHVSARTLAPVTKWARTLGRAFGQKEVLVVEVGRPHRLRL